MPSEALPITSSSLAFYVTVLARVVAVLTFDLTGSCLQRYICFILRLVIPVFFCVFDVLPIYVVFLRFLSHFFVLRPFFVFILREVMRDVAH